MPGILIKHSLDGQISGNFEDTDTCIGAIGAIGLKITDVTAKNCNTVVDALGCQDIEIRNISSDATVQKEPTVPVKRVERITVSRETEQAFRSMLST